MNAAMSWRTGAAVICLLAAHPADADEPYLVRDIDPRPGSEVGSGARPVRVGDTVFVIAADDEHGHELWVSDGTPAGTRLLRDICPGECPASPVVQGSLGGRLLFSAVATPTGEPRLWISDGSWEGTRPLGSGPITSAVGTLGGFLFFEAAIDDRNGLWVTDGTRAGTKPLVGPRGWPDPTIGFGVPSANGKLFFDASIPGGSGFEPWVTDGTEPGTRPLFAPETADAEFQSHPFFDLPTGTVFFTRSTEDGCRSTLWVSDGTTPGTRTVRVFDETECFEVIDSPVLATGDALYFVVHDPVLPPQLWRSDGTTAGRGR